VLAAIGSSVLPGASDSAKELFPEVGGLELIPVLVAIKTLTASGRITRDPVVTDALYAHGTSLGFLDRWLKCYSPYRGIGGIFSFLLLLYISKRRYKRPIGVLCPWNCRENREDFFLAISIFKNPDL
jgi:hypothetical protein